MSYQVLQRVTGRREVRRVNLPIVPWGRVTLASTIDEFGNSTGDTGGACFIVEYGDLYSWFRESTAQSNANYILGDDRAALFSPGKIEAVKNVVSVSVGVDSYTRAAHGLALTSGGDVYAWGDNSCGQCGDSLDVGSLPARKIPGLTNIDFVSANAFVSGFVDKNGGVYALGKDWNGTIINTPSIIDLPYSAVEIVGHWTGNWAYLDANGNVHLFRWTHPSYESHITVWSGGGMEQIRPLANKSFYRHRDGRLFSDEGTEDSAYDLEIRAKNISNNGFYIDSEGNLASLSLGTIAEGPFTETGGVVSRNGSKFYAANTQWTKVIEVYLSGIAPEEPDTPEADLESIAWLWSEWDWTDWNMPWGEAHPWLGGEAPELPEGHTDEADWSWMWVWDWQMTEEGPENAPWGDDHPWL